MERQRGPQAERTRRFNPRPKDGWFLPPKEIAEVLRISSMSVYRLIERGEIQAIRVGRSFRITEGELARYIARQESKGAMPA
jgi:excisionase family DNA binding protein